MEVVLKIVFVYCLLTLAFGIYCVIYSSRKINDYVNTEKEKDISNLV